MLSFLFNTGSIVDVIVDIVDIVYLVVVVLLLILLLFSLYGYVDFINKNIKKYINMVFYYGLLMWPTWCNDWYEPL